MADPALAHARSKLSLHELRLIIKHAKADQSAAPPPDWFLKYVVPHREARPTPAGLAGGAS